LQTVSINTQLFALLTAFCEIPESITCLKANYVYWGKLVKHEFMTKKMHEGHLAAFNKKRTDTDGTISTTSGSEQYDPYAPLPRRSGDSAPQRRTVKDVILSLSTR